MRVILVLNDLPPDHYGGIEVLTLNLAKNLSNRGINVLILTRKLPHHESTDLVDGITVKRVGIPFRTHSTSYIHKIIWFLSYIFIGSLVCIKFRPNVIHSNIRIPGGILSGVLGYITSGSSFLSIQSNLDSISFFERVMGKLVLKMNQNIIVPTIFSKKQVLRFCSNKVLVIPNGINFETERIKVNRFSNEILFVGRIHPIKGLEYAIKGCRILKDREISFQFILVGTGPGIFKLKKLVRKLSLEDRVFFLGKVSEEEKLAVLKGASYFLLPSLSECFPITIIEAMKERLYVIATKVGGLPEMLVHGKLGELIPPKDELALANTLEKIFKKEESIKQEKVKKVFHFAKRRFDLNVVSNQVLKCYYLT